MLEKYVQISPTPRVKSEEVNVAERHYPLFTKQTTAN